MQCWGKDIRQWPALKVSVQLYVLQPCVSCILTSKLAIVANNHIKVVPCRRSSAARDRRAIVRPPSKRASYAIEDWNTLIVQSQKLSNQKFTILLKLLWFDLKKKLSGASPQIPCPSKQNSRAKACTIRAQLAIYKLGLSLLVWLRPHNSLVSPGEGIYQCLLWTTQLLCLG